MSRYGLPRWYKWPQTKTLQYTKQEIKELRKWLRANIGPERFVICIKPTKRAELGGKESVVISIENPTDDFWFLFRLTWGR